MCKPFPIKVTSVYYCVYFVMFPETMECSIILSRNSITFENKFNIMRSMSAMPTTNLNNLFEKKTFHLRVQYCLPLIILKANLSAYMNYKEPASNIGRYCLNDKSMFSHFDIR